MDEKELEKLREEVIEYTKRIQKRVTLGKILNRESLSKEIKLPPGIEFTGDDWIYDKASRRSIYPSETASIALTRRDDKGNIVMTAIAAFYDNIPIVVADKTGAYIYKNGLLKKVVMVNQRYLSDDIQIRTHVFGQKAKQHWVWMNKIIGYLNSKGIRTDNNMGPYFLLRDFFYNYRTNPLGIEIIPIKAVLMEPFLNKPKEEIGAFVIDALNKNLPEKQKFFLSDMSGRPVFTDKGIKRFTDRKDSYKASGWIVSPRKEIAMEVLDAMREAIEEVGLPKNPNEKMKKLYSDIMNIAH